MAYDISNFNCPRRVASSSSTHLSNSQSFYTSSDMIFTIFSPGYFGAFFGFDGAGPINGDLIKINAVDGTTDAIVTDFTTGAITPINMIENNVGVAALTFLNTFDVPLTPLTYYAEAVPLTLNVEGAITTTISAVASRIGKMVMLNVIGFDFTVTDADKIRIDLPFWISPPVGQTVFPTTTITGFVVIGSVFTPALFQGTIGVDSNSQITIFNLANSQVPFNIGDGIAIEDFTLSYNIA